MSQDNGQPKTYQELQQEAAQRWRENVVAHAARQAAIQSAIAEMPDVKYAPLVGSTWSNELIYCKRCDGHVFTVLRWACVNGKRYMTEVQCASCQRIGTWHFEENRWV